jgi:catechol 2,3-dioxygenase-like lactoylglutathione lyase family enzyme
MTLDVMAHHSLDFWLTSEDLPDPENRVTLDRDGQIVLRYTPNNGEGHKRLIRKLEYLLQHLDGHMHLVPRNLFVGNRIPLAGVAHQNGTIRFGRDPKSSALDVNCRAHEVDNLYVVDGSFFPSSGAVNPALTIMANALRVGDHIAARLGARARGRGGRGMSARAHVRAVTSALIVAAAAVGAGTLRGAGGQESRTEPTAVMVTAVDSVGITVSDMDRAVRFYTSVLSFETISDVEVSGREYELLSGVFGARMRVVRLQLGDESIELTEFLAPKGRRVPDDIRPNDRVFQHIAIIVSDMDEAYRRLRQAGVEHASTAPQTLPQWNPNAAGIKAFYFRDPDRHFLEILQFPPAKGAAKWHRTDRLFLGIDHTAIVVDDTERSLQFYRDSLKLGLAGGSENYDLEQEHLNNVFGARLRITTLRASRGPGIELLEYLAPRDGRPAPLDLRANDLSHWQTTLITSEPERIFDLVRLRVFSLVSPTAVNVPSRKLGFGRAVLVRDPDGHAMRLASP